MYKFTSKEDSSIVKYGRFCAANQGWDMFTEITADGILVEGAPEIRVENVEMNGSNLTNELYTVEEVK